MEESPKLEILTADNVTSPQQSPEADTDDEIVEQDEIIPIELWESQIDHFNRIISILMLWHVYLDTSPMGAGKTVVTLAVCAALRLNLVVIGPLSTLSMWEHEAAKYGVRLLYAMSYQKLAGTSKSGCNHALLDRGQTEFVATQHLDSIIQARTMFVFDESHNVKNADTAQLSAAHTIIRAVARANCGSRGALLSATPCDKKIHAQSIHKMLGIIQNRRLYDYDKSTREYTLLGIRELFQFCDHIDKATARAIYEPIAVTNKSSNELCYDLYTGIVKGHLSSAMQKPDIIAQKDARNGYYDMSQEDVDNLRAAEMALRTATRYREDTGTVEIRTGSWGNITAALVALEKAKLTILVRLAREKLQEDPNYKVIIYVWYIDSIKYLESRLAEFNPLIMYGNTKRQERDATISLFQQDNTTSRLLISNAKVGGIGISLDDRSGTKPRFMFMVPSYNFIDLHQCTGRCHRGTTKSDATIRFIFSKQFQGETSILNAIARKTEVAKSMLYDARDALFPGDYDMYIEGEGNKPNPNNPTPVTTNADGHRLGYGAGIDDDDDKVLSLRMQMQEYLNV